MWPYFGKPYIHIHLGTCKMCGKTQLKFSEIFKIINLFAHSDKATSQPSCYEVPHLAITSFFKEIYIYILNYIRPCSSFTVRGTAN